jgi:hypothetical protein
MVTVNVAEDPSLGLANANPGDYRCVIFLIGEDHAIGQDGAQRAEARLIGDIAGRKDESGGFSVKIGDLRFRFNHGVAVAGDVSRTAGASTMAARG